MPENHDKDVLHLLLAQIIRKVGFIPWPRVEFQDGHHSTVTYHLVYEHPGGFSVLWSHRSFQVRKPLALETCKGLHSRCWTKSHSGEQGFLRVKRLYILLLNISAGCRISMLTIFQTTIFCLISVPPPHRK